MLLASLSFHGCHLRFEKRAWTILLFSVSALKCQSQSVHVLIVNVWKKVIFALNVVTMLWMFKFKFRKWQPELSSQTPKPYISHQPWQTSGPNMQIKEQIVFMYLFRSWKYPRTNHKEWNTAFIATWTVKKILALTTSCEKAEISELFHNTLKIIFLNYEQHRNWTLFDWLSSKKLYQVKLFGHLFIFDWNLWCIVYSALILHLFCSCFIRVCNITSETNYKMTDFDIEDSIGARLADKNVQP